MNPIPEQFVDLTFAVVLAVVASHVLTEVVKQVRKGRTGKRPPRYQSIVWGMVFAGVIAPLYLLLLVTPTIRELLAAALIAGPCSPAIWYGVEGVARKFTGNKKPPPPPEDDDDDKTVMDRTVFYLKG